MELNNSPKKLKKAIGKIDTVNDDRPPGAIMVPPALIEKYNNKIGTVWWFAKGRDTDPTIGVEIEGIRKTSGGYTHHDWWYFMKTVHPAQGEDELPQCYWYRKKKVPNPSNPDDYEIIEEYVGERLHDPETGLDLEIPPEIKHPLEDLCG